ncbi:MAG: hypothetical protein A3I09_00935 [Deltaproteobacteria bacterium RIFCSPLOWO2_02_FULL_47_10]|nr:MAG: hypothetical protein A3I09_00935 [Deltaproteobacteria bacterium RIFCSPLOWO2_02_FULL_47_10]
MRLFSSFKHYNFRLYFTGQALSLLGIWMQGTAVSWLTWKLTSSPRWLGAVAFASQIPILIFGLFAGVVADRVKRLRLIVVIQIFAMFQAVILAFLTLTGQINAPLIFFLSLFLGVVFAFDYPARQSFLMDMVGRDNIGNAVALNSSIVHGARVMGPVVAGLIAAHFGEGMCFAVNAISFIFVLAALLMMKRNELYPQVMESHGSVNCSIKEGLRFVWNTREIRRPLKLMAIFSLAGMVYVALLPQIIGERFGGTARELGFAMSSAGFGALSGAVYLAVRKGTCGLYKIIRFFLGLAGVGSILVSVSPNLYFLIPALVITGLSGFMVVAGTNTIMQTTSPPEYRGRIMSIFTVAFFGLMPVGSLIAGQVASVVGAPFTIAIGGIICLIAGNLGKP